MSAACDRTLNLLAEGADLDHEARAHVAHCVNCSAMAGDDSALEALVSAAPAAPPMSAALVAIASQPVAPSRLRAPSVRTLAAIAPAVTVATAVVTIAIRRDFSSLSWASRWLPVLSLATLALTGVSLAAARGRDGLGASHRARLAVAAATILAFELLSILLGVQPLWGGTFEHHLACALSGLALPFALVPLTLFALRRTDAVRPSMTGASVGGAVAAVIAIIQHFECAAPSRFHTAFSHGFSFISATLFGAWLGRRWLAP
jgi:hypothetical protein